MLEPYEGKLSCTVLRGEGGSNALDLPDVQKQGDFFVESPIILLYIPLYDKIKDNQQDNREYNQARNDNGRTFVGCF